MSAGVCFVWPHVSRLSKRDKFYRLKEFYRQGGAPGSVELMIIIDYEDSIDFETVGSVAYQVLSKDKKVYFTGYHLRELLPIIPVFIPGGMGGYANIVSGDRKWIKNIRIENEATVSERAIRRYMIIGLGMTVCMLWYMF